VNIANFTGVSDPYEAPEDPDVVVDTAHESVEESVDKILAALERRGYLQSDLALVAGGQAEEQGSGLERAAS